MIDIPQLEDGEVVPDSGAYKMTLGWYHDQCCIGPSISSSGLRKIELLSPWHFWSQSDLNEHRYPEPETSDALILGRAAHCLILGDEVFDERFVYVPGNAPRKPTPQQIEAYAQGRGTEVGIKSVEFWREYEQRAAGRDFLTEAQVEKIQYMADNLRRSPEAMQALTGGMTEVSLIWEDPETGVWLKSRPDVIPDNGFDASDLKTFTPRHSNLVFAAQKAVTEHGYAMQMALASMGAEVVFGTPTSEFILIFVQTTAPYCVIPIRLDPESLHIGKILCRRAINKFAKCLETGNWPGPVEGIVDYTTPPSLAERAYQPEEA